MTPKKSLPVLKNCRPSHGHPYTHTHTHSALSTQHSVALSDSDPQAQAQAQAQAQTGSYTIRDMRAAMASAPDARRVPCPAPGSLDVRLFQFDCLLPHGICKGQGQGPQKKKTGGERHKYVLHTYLFLRFFFQCCF
jgi:hypothetical protein